MEFDKFTYEIKFFIQLRKNLLVKDELSMLILTLLITNCPKISTSRIFLQSHDICIQHKVELKISKETYPFDQDAIRFFMIALESILLRGRL